jgi:hypothetical protein
MTRRRFLVGAAALALASLGRRARSDASLPSPRGGLADEVARARRERRPLVALVKPRARPEQFERARTFGNWLFRGNDYQLLPLAGCVLACASADELARAYGAETGEPILLFVGYDEPSSTRTERLDGELPQVPLTITRPSQFVIDVVDGQRSDRLAGFVGRARDIAVHDHPFGQIDRGAAAALRDELRAHPPAGARWGEGGVFYWDSD